MASAQTKVDESDEPQSDAQLLRRCQRGDEAALALFVRRHQEHAFRLAYGVLQDASLAEDATAEVFVKVWAKSRSWRGDASPGTWLYRLAMRTALDVQRAQRRWWRRFGGVLPSGTPSVAPADDRPTVSARLRQALAELSASDRGLVHLYYFEQHSLADIADILEVSTDAVKMRLSRARQRLRSILQRSYLSDDE